MTEARSYHTEGRKVFTFKEQPKVCPRNIGTRKQPTICSTELGEGLKTGLGREEGIWKKYCKYHGLVYYNLEIKNANSTMP